MQTLFRYVEATVDRNAAQALCFSFSWKRKPGRQLIGAENTLVDIAVCNPNDIREKFLELSAEPVGCLYPVLILAGKACLEEERVFFHDPGKK